MSRCETVRLGIFFELERYLASRADNTHLVMATPPSEIVDRVLAGDLDQYREIITTFEDNVIRFAAPILGCRSLAEDVTQEVFFMAYQRLESFDRSRPFRPWLLGIAANVVRNEVRRRSREKSKIEIYSRFIDDMAASDGSTDVSVAAALVKCRNKLAKAASAAIRGRYDDGLGLEALAERLQRTVTATRQLLYRTRLALRDCIESELSGRN